MASPLFQPCWAQQLSQAAIARSSSGTVSHTRRSPQAYSARSASFRLLRRKLAISSFDGIAGGARSSGRRTASATNPAACAAAALAAAADAAGSASDGAAASDEAESLAFLLKGELGAASSAVSAISASASSSASDVAARFVVGGAVDGLAEGAGADVEETGYGIETEEE